AYSAALNSKISAGSSEMMSSKTQAMTSASRGVSAWVGTAVTAIKAATTQANSFLTLSLPVCRPIRSPIEHCEIVCGSLMQGPGIVTSPVAWSIADRLREISICFNTIEAGFNPGYAQDGCSRG